MGSGSYEWPEWATPRGMWIAESGHDLLTSAGSGAMTSVARAFCSVTGRKGRSISIVPTRKDLVGEFIPLPGYPNRFINLPIVTPLPRKESSHSMDRLTRTCANILGSDLMVALPGGSGTKDEASLCCRFRKPLLYFGPTSAFDGFSTCARGDPVLSCGPASMTMVSTKDSGVGGRCRKLKSSLSQTTEKSLDPSAALPCGSLKTSKRSYSSPIATAKLH